MSYSLQLIAGDLAIQGSKIATVSGVDKLRQDLDLWVRDNYGLNRFHPDYGSVLDSFIGGIIGPTTTLDVQAEVYRVLTNYQNLQLRRFKANPSKFSNAELLQDIVSVDVSTSYDTVTASVVVRTAAGVTANLNVKVSV